MINTTEEKRVKELSAEIERLKLHLTERSAYMSNRETHAELKAIGELLTEKNELTGLNEDVQYLYIDDGEWYRAVEGFVGDYSGTTDCNGVRLKIGDTVSLDGFPRVILKNMPSQNAIIDCRGVKIKDCVDLDIKDAFASVFTISLCSCLKDYENSLDCVMGMML